MDAPPPPPPGLAAKTANVSEGKRFQLFGTKCSAAQRAGMLLDDVAVYSVTDARTADRITKFALKLPGGPFEAITDGCACVGGNVISFARALTAAGSRARVCGIELDEARCGMLRHNVATAGVDAEVLRGEASSDSSDSDEASEDGGPEDPAAATSAKRWFANPLFGDFPEMPQTEKELRKAKRRRALERQERRDQRRRDDLGDEDLKVVARKTKREEQSLARLPPAKRAQAEAKQRESQELIRQGVGSVPKDDSGFEVAPRTAAAAALDEDPENPFRRLQKEQTYLSDSEDDDQKAETLALATMMLRKSNAKKLVDASYNRFAWNDPRDLPPWFVDDERRHYRPQLPIKPQLLAEMKARFQSLAAKPIKKVAEARARKKTRADARLKAAKKRAEAVANDPDMSAGRKLKEVEKAMARAVKQKRPDKVYVVASKSKSGVRKTTSAPKGAAKGSRVVSVDARMKKDKRSLKAAAKRKKKWKSKKR